MLDSNSCSEDTLNTLSLIARSLYFLGSEREGSQLAALLQLLAGTLEECLLVLDASGKE